MIVLYTIGCPKCKQLERLLDKNKIKYETCSDINTMNMLGMREVPQLDVNGTLMNFAQAWNWAKQQEVK